MEVTTQINLLSVVSDLSGKNLGDTDANYSSGEFFNLIDKVFDFFDGFKKWEDSDSTDGDFSDEVLLFHKGMKSEIGNRKKLLPQC